MIPLDLFNNHPPAPSAQQLAEFEAILPKDCALIDHYRRCNGGLIETGEVYMRWFPISEILELRKSGNAGWGPTYCFFGGDGGSEGYGVFTDEPEVFYSTQWVASPEDVSRLGNVCEFVAALCGGKLM